MKITVTTVGISILIFMIAAYIFSFHLGWSFWYWEFIEFLRFINFPDIGWIWLDNNFYNGKL